MPSGGLTPISEEDADYVYAVAKRAAKYGLTHEWLQYLLGGVREGVPVRDAADAAAMEWDF